MSDSNREVKYRLYSFQMSLDRFYTGKLSASSETLESILIHKYSLVHASLGIANSLQCLEHAQFLIHQQHFIELEQRYYAVETTRFDQRKVLHDYLHYKQSFIAFFQYFTPMDIPDGDEAGEICNALYRRSFMEHLLLYLRQHDCIEYDQEIAGLKSVLYAQYPQAEVEKLGSITDPDYQCSLLIPSSHWWFYREGYNGRNI